MKKKRVTQNKSFSNYGNKLSNLMSHYPAWVILINDTDFVELQISLKYFVLYIIIQKLSFILSYFILLEVRFWNCL